MGRPHCTELAGDFLQLARERAEADLREEGLEPVAIVTNAIFRDTDSGTLWAIATTAPAAEPADLAFLANSLRVSADEATEAAATNG